MPKRATLTFSSDDNQSAATVDLFVYYCKYSGRHVLTTDCEIDRAPKRRSDEASVIDTEKYQVGNRTFPPVPGTGSFVPTAFGSRHSHGMRSMCSKGTCVLQVKLYASECGPKLIKRHTGAIERQFRLHCGKLPIGYRCSVCINLSALCGIVPASIEQMHCI